MSAMKRNGFDVLGVFWGGVIETSCVMLRTIRGN